MMEESYRLLTQNHRYLWHTDHLWPTSFVDRVGAYKVEDKAMRTIIALACVLVSNPSLAGYRPRRRC
jgi:hypothetical protein